MTHQQAGGGAAGRFFDAHQRETIAAAMARIIPTDDQPGAREAGTIDFGLDYPLPTAEDLEETVAQVRALGRRAVAVRADVRDPAQLASALAHGTAELGAVSAVDIPIRPVHSGCYDLAFAHGQFVQRKSFAIPQIELET